MLSKEIVKISTLKLAKNEFPITKLPDFSNFVANSLTEVYFKFPDISKFSGSVDTRYKLLKIMYFSNSG